MIFLNLRVNIFPDKNKELLQTVSEIVNSTRKKTGCKSSHLYQDVEDNKAFSLVEEWESQADLDSHLQSEDWRVLLGAVHVLGEQSQITLNTVSYTESIGVVEAALVEAG